MIDENRMFGACRSCRSGDIIIIANKYQRETFTFQVILYFMFECNYVYL